MTVKQIMDKAYKFIFRNPEIFLQLLHHFIDEEFIKTISVDQLEIVEKGFISEEFIKRESDIVYRVSSNTREFTEHVNKLTEILINENIINRKQFSQWANMLFRPEEELDFGAEDTIYLKKGDNPMLVEMGQLFKAEGIEEG